MSDERGLDRVYIGVQYTHLDTPPRVVIDAQNNFQLELGGDGVRYQLQQTTGAPKRGRAKLTFRAEEDGQVLVEWHGAFGRFHATLTAEDSAEYFKKVG